MTPIDQTILDTVKGDCVPACIASVLEIPIEDVPNVCLLYEDSWGQHLNDFLRRYGIYMISLPVASCEEMAVPLLGYHLMGGPSIRGVKHCVVGKNGRMIHDPHPSRAGLLEIEYYDVFVTTNPSSRIYNAARLIWEEEDAS